MTLLDFDARQYRLLLALLRDLGARRELTSQIGLDQSALRFVGPVLVMIGGLFSLIVLGQPSALGFSLGALFFTAVFMIPLLVSEATDAFMNPAEASVLAHRPIRGSTYLAAKLTYVLKTAVMLALPLNLIPSVAGLALPGTRWFYPGAHLVAAAGAASFTALLACGLFGVLFRILPIGNLRAGALWMQIVAMMLGPIAPQLMHLFGHRFDFNLHASYWSAVPLMWFARIALIGQAARPPIWWMAAGPTAIACLVVLAIGAHALSQTYMTRVVMLMRARGTHRRLRAGATWRAAWARVVPGGPAARAAAAFVPKMALRDWQFRRGFMQGHVGMIVLMGVAIARSGFGSPLAPRGDRGFVQMLPHIDGFLLIMICLLLSYSDAHRARWMFLTVPLGTFKAFVRGMLWSLWAFGIAAPHLVLLVAGVWSWGWHDGLVFTIYSLSVASFYLSSGLWLAGGLPFTQPPRPSRAAAHQGVVMVLMLAGLVLVGFQALFILRFEIATLAATLAFGVAALVTGTASLRILEVKIKAGLDDFVAGPSRMFVSSHLGD